MYNQTQLEAFARILRDLLSLANPDIKVANAALSLSQCLYEDKAELHQDAVVEGLKAQLTRINAVRKARKVSK